MGLTLALDLLRETSEFTSSWRRVPRADRMGGWDAFLEEEGQQMERRHRFQAPEPEIYEAGGAGVPACMGCSISHGSAAQNRQPVQTPLLCTNTDGRL